MGKVLVGSFLEAYATVDGDRRYIPKTTDNVYIDAKTGAVEITILVEDDTDALTAAFLTDEDGRLTGRDEYDRFELDVYEMPGEDAEPVARYYAEGVDVEADIEFPIDQDVTKTYVTVTPRGVCGFESLRED